MKYMGSKRAMLKNGLGETLEGAIDGARRVLDLFTGSAAVAWHVAQRHPVEVVASDLQLYSTTLASAILSRTSPIIDLTWIESWIERASSRLIEESIFRDAQALQSRLGELPIEIASENARALCATAKALPISLSYGGYYLSPLQSIWLDALRQTLPDEDILKSVALASLIQTASRASASPGHTAQPFKANDTAGRFLLEAWRRDVVALAKSSAAEICSKYALRKGQAICGDALQVAELAQPGDLAFLDPPYSGVHYSRFYHVLETVARGSAGAAEGAGRYPPPSERPHSDFSITTKSGRAFDLLLNTLAEKGASAIVTFPAGIASNGLSGEAVKIIAEKHFHIDLEKVSSRFSTLGGNTKNRIARHDTHELILRLSPR
ncbi:DNA adenine methylase [Rhizobium sp. ZW T2_16]|uniref:DNA adenine methylase n=1 Tax=Rhizobium sp. ZW T2_16 TaxID=3378083 RepID=UPI003851E996